MLALHRGPARASRRGWVVLVWLTGYVSLGSICRPRCFRWRVFAGGRTLAVIRWRGVLARGVHHLEPSGQPQRLLHGNRERFGAAPRRDPGRGARRGEWGTTLADLLARKGEDVRIWAYEPEVVEAINRRHENPMYLPDCALAPRLAAATDARDTVRGAEVIVSAAPSHAVRAVRGGWPRVGSDTLVVSATKGIELDTLASMSAVVRDTLPGRGSWRSRGRASRRRSARASRRPWWRPRPSRARRRPRSSCSRRPPSGSTPHDDVIGVELGGALKNVMPIAAGILEGLGPGHNSRAALITRGLAEITRLGVAHGRRPADLRRPRRHGRSGAHDHRQPEPQPGAGRGAGAGRDARASTGRRTGRVAEGANASRAGAALGARTGVEMPIIREGLRGAVQRQAGPRRAWPS